ncbi:hypothetical protein EDB80DRAFT_865884 [Ilyonectria destructans]|nr:hypothetical protein EDB80DRAFT_865884 [Ilyonectria destructans]
MRQTVLSTTILDHLQASERIVLSFVFDFNDAAKRTTDGMLRSLASQLCQRSAQSEAQLYSLFQSHRDGRSQPIIGALLDVVRKMLGNNKIVYVVLDALDESTARPELLRNAINADIHSYVTERLDQSPEFTRWARYPKVFEQIRTTIGRKSDGM